MTAARSTWLSSVVLLGVGGLWACGAPPAKPGEIARKPGLESRPAQLAFICVTPGCDTQKSLEIKVVGTRRVAVKRVVVEGAAQADFTLNANETVPFILGTSGKFTIDVRYQPKGSPGDGTVNLVVAYTDASAVESPDRIEPGELVIPLLRRLVGEPALGAHPPTLSFGALAVGEMKTLNTRLRNEGFGNVTVELAAVDAGHKDVLAELPAERTLLSDAGVDLPVTYKPKSAGYLRTHVLVTPTSESLEPASIEVEGTSLTVPRVGVEPEGEVEFGEVPRKQKRTLTRRLVNQGGKPLEVKSIVLTGGAGNVKVAASRDLPAILDPLERLPFDVLMEGVTVGSADSVVVVTSDDPQTPRLDIPVKALVTEPKLTLAPNTADFGTVPVGWVVTKTVELKNTGYGALTLKNISLVSGSSNLFAVRRKPETPAILERDQRVAVELEFRAESPATFSGFLSVETDDPEATFREVSLKAFVGSCSVGCPIANGTPTCASGKCEVNTCNAGFYDADRTPSNGCECKEVGTDPGSFCAEARNSGTLVDNDKTQASATGIIPTESDVDLIRFFADDAFSLFSDNYNVKIRLESNDPAVKFCVYRYPTGDHQNECFFTNENCPGNRSYHQGNGGAGGDDADFIVKVFRDASSALTCTPYTVYMSNGL